MSADQWYENLLYQQRERIRGEVSGFDFDMLVQYFQKLRKEEENFQTLFSPGEPMEISNLLLSHSPQEIVAHCKTSAEKYKALKRFVNSRFFPSVPHPFKAQNHQGDSLYDLGMELFKDLLSEQPGPITTSGRNPSPAVASRNARIKNYFHILSAVTSLPKGTNKDDKHPESCVKVLAKVFCCSTSTIRDALKP